MELNQMTALRVKKLSIQLIYWNSHKIFLILLIDKDTTFMIIIFKTDIYLFCV